jgi:hypothetical protein
MILISVVKSNFTLLYVGNLRIAYSEEFRFESLDSGSHSKVSIGRNEWCKCIVKMTWHNEGKMFD